MKAGKSKRKNLTGNGIWQGILLLILLCRPLHLQAAFAGEELLFAGASEDGYRYEWEGHGGFYTNVQEGESEEFVFFMIDETLDYQLFREKTAYSYEQEELLLESGSYELYLFDKTQNAASEYCIFSFRIVSEVGSAEINYAGQWAAGFSDLEVRKLEMDFFYDREEELFLYSASGYEMLRTSVPNGAVVSAPVILKPAEGVTQTVYRNGEYTALPEGGVCCESGFYKCVQILCPETDPYASEEIPFLETTFYFRIINGQEEQVNVAGAPEGFSLEHVYYRGEEQKIPEHGYYFLHKDGNYTFYFVSCNEPDLFYTLDITRDTQAPFLYFDQKIEGGRALTPLSFFMPEDVCDCQITRNSIHYDGALKSPLTTGGYYEIIVSDQYGNSRKYCFYLEASYRFFSPGMLLILTAAAAILGGFLIKLRHNLKVI